MHAIIFDIDGTLIRSVDVDDRLYRQSVCDVLGPVQFRPSLTDYRYVTDSGILSEVLADNGLTLDINLADSIKALFAGSLKDHMTQKGPFDEVPGARDLLNCLRGSDNHQVAIATGGWRVTAELKLTSARFDTSGIPVATSDNHFDRTEIMCTALSQLGDSMDTITYYGDGPWDRDACEALGWNFAPVGPALGGLESFSPVLQKLAADTTAFAKSSMNPDHGA